MSSVPEVQDWTRVVQLYAWDGTQLRPVKVDSSGQLYILMQGYDGTTFVPIKVDAEGNIVSIMKATYGTDLKTVACDDKGRMIMIPTDPADIWGNAISMGNAELAAVLTPFRRFDRRGNIIYATDFFNGLGVITVAGVGTGNIQELSSEALLGQHYSLKLVGGSDSTRVATATTRIFYCKNQKVGVEYAWSCDTNTEYVEIQLGRHDGTNLIRGCIRYNAASNKVEYMDNDGNWQGLISDFLPISGAKYYNYMKLVIDLSAGTYLRALVNDQEVNMSSYTLRTTGSGTAKNLMTQIAIFSLVGTNTACYVGEMNITVNEPA